MYQFLIVSPHVAPAAEPHMPVMPMHVAIIAAAHSTQTSTVQYPTREQSETVTRVINVLAGTMLVVIVAMGCIELLRVIFRNAKK